MAEPLAAVAESAVAIVGAVARVPGAGDLDAYWSNLSAGAESIATFSDEELLAAGVPQEALDDPSYVKRRGVVPGYDQFDNEFFGVSPRDAALMDPQHRLLLEACYHAFEDGGYVPGPGVVVDVYAGAAPNTYLHEVVVPHSPDLAELEGLQAQLGNENSFLSTRISYKLNLTGASVTIDTACSTGLVAVHLACQSLLSGQCDMAVAAGVAIPVPQVAGYRYHPDAIVSPDGRCRAFDAQALGFVDGSGVAAVLLKRLPDALADRDRVRAVIRGSAVNNDGSAKIGFTAPSVSAQAAVIRDAMALARVTPDDVDYVEAHGTATKLGDPIEVAALAEAFAGRAADGPKCRIGSVKTNIGHLGAASGLAGLLKVVLAFEHDLIPPSLHYRAPNPEIDFDAVPFRVNDRPTPWARGDRPRISGVTSLGMGGTNAHLVVEEGIEPASAPPARPWHVLPISARSEEALAEARDRLANRLDARPDLPLADVAYTLAVGRRPFGFRAAAVVGVEEDAGAAVRGAQGAATRADAPLPVAFLFPGQGAQYARMSRELRAAEAAFREPFDECAEILLASHGVDLTAALDTAPDSPPTDTRIVQPALFAVEYALAQMWMEWGVRPAALLGHSVGEVAAACLAGVFSLADALRVVVERGRLMADLPRGAMLAVDLPAAEVRAELEEPLAIAVDADRGHCVVAGPEEPIAQLTSDFERRGVRARRLRTSHAFHSAMMDDAVAPLAQCVGAVRREPPAIRLLSNLTGTWIAPSEATAPGYWAQQLRRTVKLRECIDALAGAGPHVLVEVGPGRSLLSSSLRQQAEAFPVTIASLPSPGEDRPESRHLTEAIARAWSAGVGVDWDAYYRREQRTRVAVPLYPFARRRHWLDGPARPRAAASAAPADLPSPPSPAPAASLDRVRLEVVGVVADVAGLDIADVDPAQRFLAQGFDSIALLNLAHAVRATFAVEVSLAQLFEELSAVDRLAPYVADRIDPGRLEPDPAETPAASLGAEVPLRPDGNDVRERVIARQLEIMAEQLRVLSGEPLAPDVARTAAAPAIRDDAHDGSPSRGAAIDLWGRQDKVAPRAGDAPDETDERLADFVERYVRRTRGSKALAARDRIKHADPRNSANFHSAWKEIVYPIAATRSAGSRIWDVDDNEYVDLAMGFGVHLFGHRPPFIVEALERQLELGYQLGPHSPVAGAVAERLCALTGMERAAFCNTGSEAMMTAVRIARSATNRRKIAIFAGSYHGTFDGLVARPAPGGSGRASGAPGTPPGMLEDVLVLEYGSDQSLEVLRARASELAAIVVEPVQSRFPDRQLPEFLRSLREIADAGGAALLFDEIITGFRVHPGGGQAWSGVRADLAAYGKVIGGGLPIGVVAGRGAFLDVVDGGSWSYGDDSVPSVPQTFFAGTFCKHPLAMAATAAVLDHLSEEGPALQEGLTRRTTDLVGALNDVFERERLPVTTVSFASLFGFRFGAEVRSSDLFFYRLIDKGVYTWEGRTCFMSTAHSEADLEQVLDAFEATALECERDGFLPRLSMPPREAPQRAAREHDVIPLTDGQKQVWIASSLGDGSAYNEVALMRVLGRFDTGAFARALEAVVGRHDILRARFSTVGDAAVVGPAPSVDLTLTDVSHVSPAPAEPTVARELADRARRPLDLVDGGPLRVELVRMAPDRHLLALTIHHLVTDAWSTSVLLDELARYYDAFAAGRELELPQASQFGDHVRWLEELRESGELARHAAYWAAKFADGPPDFELRLDFPRRPTLTFTGARHRHAVPPRLAEAVATTAKSAGTTTFALLLAAFEVTLARCNDASETLVGIHAAGQAARGLDDLVGYCVNILPVARRVDPARRFSELLADVRADVVEAFEHQWVPFGGLHRVGHGGGARRMPMTVAFNLDRVGDGLRLGECEIEPVSEPAAPARWDLALNCVESGGELILECVYNADLLREETVAGWLHALGETLDTVTADANQRIADLLAAREPARGTDSTITVGRRRAGPPSADVVSESAISEARGTR